MLPLPQTTEYALRAVLRLSEHHPQSVPVGALAEAVGAPANYLSKTLNQLVRAGLLISSRGPAGGFRLRTAPNEITLESIVRLFAPREPNQCLLGGAACGANPGCPVHARWAPIAAEVAAFLRSTTMADLLTSSNGSHPSRHLDQSILSFRAMRSI